MKMQKIISELTEYEKNVKKLMDQNFALRQEIERLKKELNKTNINTDQNKDNHSSDLENLSIKEISEMLFDTESPKVILDCLDVLLVKDKTEGRYTSPIISDMVKGPYLPKEGYKKIFEDIKANCGNKKISDKYLNRLTKMVTSFKLPYEMVEEVARFFVRKYYQKHTATEWAIKRIKYISSISPERMQRKLNFLIRHYFT